MGKNWKAQTPEIISWVVLTALLIYVAYKVGFNVADRTTELSQVESNHEGVGSDFPAAGENGATSKTGSPPGGDSLETGPESDPSATPSIDPFAAPAGNGEAKDPLIEVKIPRSEWPLFSIPALKELPSGNIEASRELCSVLRLTPNERRRIANVVGDALNQFNQISERSVKQVEDRGEDTVFFFPATKSGKEIRSFVVSEINAAIGEDRAAFFIDKAQKFFDRNPSIRDFREYEMELLISPLDASGYVHYTEIIRDPESGREIARNGTKLAKEVPWRYKDIFVIKEN